MELTEFVNLAALLDDYQAAREVHAKALAAAREITVAVRSRLEAERDAQETRKAEIQEILSDSNRAESAHRLAMMERDRMVAPAIAEDERAAFGEEVSVATTAIDELRGLEARLKDSFAACEAALKAARKESLAHPVDTTLLERRVEGTKEEFALLGRG